jgi:hypothetical protein
MQSVLMTSFGIDPSSIIASSDTALMCAIVDQGEEEQQRVTNNSFSVSGDYAASNADALVVKKDDLSTNHVQSRLFSLPPRSTCVVIPYPVVVVTPSRGEGANSEFASSLCVDAQQQRERQPPLHYDFPHRMFLETRFPASSSDSDRCADAAAEELSQQGCPYRPLDVLGELEREMAVKRQALTALGAFHAELRVQLPSSKKPSPFLSRAVQPY